MGPRLESCVNTNRATLLSSPSQKALFLAVGVGPHSNTTVGQTRCGNSRTLVTTTSDRGYISYIHTNHVASTYLTQVPDDSESQALRAQRRVIDTAYKVAGIEGNARHCNGLLTMCVHRIGYVSATQVEGTDSGTGVDG